MDINDTILTEASVRDQIKALMGQIMIALIKKSGSNELRISIADVDATGDHMMFFEVNQETKEFILKIEKKQ